MRCQTRALTETEYMELLNHMAQTVSEKHQEIVRLERQHQVFRTSLDTGRPLTDQGIRRLRKLKTEIVRDKRDYVIARLMIEAGVPMSEIVRVNVGDLCRNVSKSKFTLCYGRGENVQLARSTTDAILDYFEARMIDRRILDHSQRLRLRLRDDEPLFESYSNNRRGRLVPKTVRMMVKRNLGAVGLDSPDVTAHSLRQTHCRYFLMGSS